MSINSVKQGNYVSHLRVGLDNGCRTGGYHGIVVNTKLRTLPRAALYLIPKIIVSMIWLEKLTKVQMVVSSLKPKHKSRKKTFDCQ